MHCKLKYQDTKGNTDLVNLSRDYEIALIGSEVAGKGHTLDFWVEDTGATCHMVSRDEGMFDYIPGNQHVFVEDGRALKVKKVGKLQHKITKAYKDH
jgi:hypothetical protein